MRIIFSRKGFDSSAGGCPSPLLDGRPVSLPIPSATPSPTRFSELPPPIPVLVSDLSRGRIDPRSFCHLDPDLDAPSRPRAPGWRGAFGQAGAAQGHLRRQGVGVGDLFLFWGLFRNVQRDRRWRFVGAAEHRVFGWLQVGEVLDVGEDAPRHLRTHPWLVDHPHMRRGWPASNTVYIASPRLEIAGVAVSRPGWGIFDRGHRLTRPGSKLPSVWQVPPWLDPRRRGTGMTYHPPARWGEDGTVRTAARGQEFVADVTTRRDATTRREVTARREVATRKDVAHWLRNLFEADS